MRCVAKIWYYCTRYIFNKEIKQKFTKFTTIHALSMERERELHLSLSNFKKSKLEFLPSQLKNLGNQNAKHPNQLQRERERERERG